MKLNEILKGKKAADFIQFIKFGIVGVSNTLISYGVEMLCFYVLFSDVKFISAVSFLNKIGILVKGETVKVIVISAIAFIISVTNTYLLNNRFVFKNGSKNNKRHIYS